MPHARLNNIYTDEVEVLYMKKLITILLISTLLTAFAMADAGDMLPNAIVMRGIAVSMDLDGDGKEETLRWDLVDVDEYTSSLTLTVVDTEGTQINYPTELIGGQAVYATDMDGDGIPDTFDHIAAQPAVRRSRSPRCAPARRWWGSARPARTA